MSEQRRTRPFDERTPLNAAARAHKPGGLFNPVPRLDELSPIMDLDTLAKRLAEISSQVEVAQQALQQGAMGADGPRCDPGPDMYAPQASRSSTMPEMEGVERHANDVQLLVADLLTERDAHLIRIANLEHMIRLLTDLAHQNLKVIESQIHQARSDGKDNPGGDA